MKKYNVIATTVAALFADINSNDIANALEGDFSDVFETTLENEITTAGIDKDGEISEAGKLAGGKVLHALVDPATALENLDTLSDALDVRAAIGAQAEQSEITLEAFGNEDPSNIAVLSYMYNLSVARQDDFSKATYPIFIGKPGATGVSIKIPVEYTITPYARKSGASTKRTWLVKSYADINGPYVENKLKLTPVKNASNEPQLLVEPATVVTKVEDIDGSEYETAPYKIGATVRPMEIGLSPATVSKGLAQETAILNSSVELDALYLKAGDDAVKLDTSLFSGATFTYTQEGFTEEIEMSIVSTMNIPFDAFVNTEVGAAVDGLDGLVGTHYGKFAIRITGNGQIEDGTIEVYANKFELVSLHTLNGNLEEDAGLVDKAKALEVVGYDLDASTTNEDIENIGHVVTDTTYTENYTFRPFTPKAALSPITNNPAKSDAAKVEQLIRLSYYDISLQAPMALIREANFLRTKFTTLNRGQFNLKGVGKVFVDPYFVTQNLNLKTAVNSVQSHRKDSDIAAQLIISIKDIVNKMATGSGFANAHRIISKGKKIDVAVATNSDIASFLPSEIDLGVNYRVRVVSRNDIIGGMQGKIYVVFTDFDSKPDAVNPLCFGTTLYIPAIVGIGERTIGTAVTRAIICNPSIACVSNTHILGELVVTGLTDTIQEKVVVFTSEQ